MASMTQSTQRLYASTTGEPTLEEMFAEPIVKLFMERDHVDPQDIRGKLHRLLDTRKLAKV